jgi:hypothetical protein
MSTSLIPLEQLPCAAYESIDELKYPTALSYEIDWDNAGT